MSGDGNHGASPSRRRSLCCVSASVVMLAILANSLTSRGTARVGLSKPWINFTALRRSRSRRAVAIPSATAVSRLASSWFHGFLSMPLDHRKAHGTQARLAPNLKSRNRLQQNLKGCGWPSITRLLNCDCRHERGTTRCGWPAIGRFANPDEGATGAEKACSRSPRRGAEGRFPDHDGTHPTTSRRHAAFHARESSVSPVKRLRSPPTRLCDLPGISGPRRVFG
jgi:hypothetical protein